MSSPKTQTIFRAAGERSFTPIRNDFLQNPDVPYEVKGLVSEILSRPKDWHVSVPGILETNNTVGKRKLHRMLIDAQPFIRGVRDHDDKGRIECVIYYVSDDPAEVEKAIQKKISATAKELVRAMDKQKSEAASDPQRQNRIEDTEPECGFAELDNAALDFAPQQKKEEKKIYGKKEISLSPDASASAAEPARESELNLFKGLISGAPWHPATNGKPARKAFASLSPEDQLQAIGAAMLYAEACDKAASGNKRTAAEQRQFNKSLHKWLAERGFDLYPDAAKELVPGMPGVRRSVLTARVRNFLIERDRNGGSQNASWPADLGPKPGEPGCKVPAEIIDPIETEFKRLMDEERAQRKVQERYEWNGNLQASMCDSRLFMTRLIDVLKGKGNWKGHLYGPAPGEPGSLMDEHYSKWIESAREQIAAPRP